MEGIFITLKVYTLQNISDGESC